MIIPSVKIPIVELPLFSDVQLFLKREDLVHPEVSGNKYWKLLHNVNQYLEQKPQNPTIISFGGAFSNHIFALSALGKEIGIPTLGIIRGDELISRWKENSTLRKSSENGMRFRFVTRDVYRDKDALTESLQREFPDALIVPEGGTNRLAVEGVFNMLNFNTKDFDYLCIAVGTGGSIAGVSKYCEDHQRVIGLQVVRDQTLMDRISNLSNKNNFTLVEASYGGYGKITDDVVSFINEIKRKYNIPLEPIYTGKMLLKVTQLIKEDFFPKGSKILCFHTGGLQGIEGANVYLQSKKRKIID